MRLSLDANHILTEDGYDRASTNRIAERAGVSIGSLYQYFPNKEAIVAALVERHKQEMMTLVETKLSDLADASIEIVMPELIKAVLAAHAVNPKLHEVFDEQVPRMGKLKQVEGAEEQINRMLRNYLEQWRDRIRPENLDLTVFILGRTVEALCHSAVIDHPNLLTDEQLEQEMATLILLYLLKND